jgi:hypothetical protein
MWDPWHPLQDPQETRGPLVLGNVSIIGYGCSLLGYSLFEEVLKRPGAVENVVKFSPLAQDNSLAGVWS